MGKNLLVGVGSKARHVKALYVGVGGKARKVKKVYVGVGGKARLVYQSYIPVTGISLNISKDGIVTATITPSNATGSIVWSMADNRHEIVIKSTTSRTCTLTAIDNSSFAMNIGTVAARCDGVSATISVSYFRGSWSSWS